MTRSSHNSSGRASLARQGDSADARSNHKIDFPGGGALASGTYIPAPSSHSDGPAPTERRAFRDTNTANCPKSSPSEPLNRFSRSTQQAFYSIPELAVRWRCSRGTVYNRLRFAGAKVLDFASAGKKGKKLVPALTVFQIESKHLKVLP